jgi:Lon-like ATP-dependent protease
MLCAFWFISSHNTFIPCGQNQVKEKTIAARRSDVKTIIFPSANKRDFDELAENVKEGLDVHFVDEYNQIFDVAFGDDQNTGK